MNDKKSARIRRAKKTRAKIRELGATRLTVFRTSRHLYAQIIAPNGSDVICSAGTVEKDVRGAVKYTGNVDAAKELGKRIATLAKQKGVEKVAFDRSGFKYHGRIKALADAARENGLEI
ncbi:MAG: 50S ribosomal protein L18 [Gammaproteobacteria bacterium]|nr:50S ribosomal protein L18 [Gammaproteobacteria bacterium]MDH5691762.1 50S ribosomal protein L18 [Gammaproteobacteria bacterium]